MCHPKQTNGKTTFKLVLNSIPHQTRGIDILTNKNHKYQNVKHLSKVFK